MPTVLVIDDEPAILEIVQRFLERDGFNVLTANDGLTGLTAQVFSFLTFSQDAIQLGSQVVP